MIYHAFLIKYAEIGIKGKNRGIFEEDLVNQIHIALKKCTGRFRIARTSGRIFVYCESEYDYDEVVGALRYVFGIVGICPVRIIDVVPVPELKKAAAEFFGSEYPDRHVTFKVQTRRLARNYPMDSMEVNAEIGEAILTSYPETKVDVHNPEVMLHVEIRERIYMYSHIIPGPGGLPVGSAGKAMLLLSGGIDSPVAGWMCSKRGLKLDATYFNAPPYTSERALQKVVDLAKLVSRYSGPIYLHNINFTKIQLYIYEKCPHDELTIIMRRYMMRIAEIIAKRTGSDALITGESIGQVASQTTRSLGVTNAVCTLPVFRPLIAFDKEDIVTLSKKIGTYDTSILPYEDCCTIFVAKHPVTKPVLSVIERHERNLTEKIDEMVEEALATDEILVVDVSGVRCIKHREDPLKEGM
jgi:thiamine biosynthesis protein ThiI